MHDATQGRCVIFDYILNHSLLRKAKIGNHGGQEPRDRSWYKSHEDCLLTHGLLSLLPYRTLNHHSLFKSQYVVVDFFSHNVGKTYLNHLGPNDWTPGIIPHFKHVRFYSSSKSRHPLPLNYSKFPRNTKSVFLQDISRMELNNTVPWVKSLWYFSESWTLSNISIIIVC